MKHYLFTIPGLILASCCSIIVAQTTPANSTIKPVPERTLYVVGELRMGETAAQSYYVPYAKVESIEIKYKSAINDSNLKLEKVELERYDTKEGPGTRVIFIFPESEFDKIVKTQRMNTAALGVLRYVDKRNKSSIKNVNMTFFIPFSPHKKRGSEYIELAQPILLGEPEIFTVTMMIEEIDETIANYRSDIDLLKVITTPNSKKDLSVDNISKLIEARQFLNLVVKGDGSRQSFLKKEAEKLKVIIESKKTILSDSTNTLQRTGSAISDYIDFSNVYQMYIEKMAEYDGILYLIDSAILLGFKKG